MPQGTLVAGNVDRLVGQRVGPRRAQPDRAWRDIVLQTRIPRRYQQLMQHALVERAPTAKLREAKPMVCLRNGKTVGILEPKPQATNLPIGLF